MRAERVIISKSTRLKERELIEKFLRSRLEVKKNQSCSEFTEIKVLLTVTANIKKYDWACYKRQKSSGYAVSLTSLCLLHFMFNPNFIRFSKMIVRLLSELFCRSSPRAGHLMQR